MGLFGTCDGQDNGIANGQRGPDLCSSRGRKEIAEAAFERIKALVANVPSPVAWEVKYSFLEDRVNRLCDHHADVLVRNAGEVARSRCPLHPDHPYRPNGPWVPLAELPRDDLHCMACVSDSSSPYAQRQSEEKSQAAARRRASSYDPDDGLYEAAVHEAWLRDVAEGGEL